jgi:hypothetical protein
MTVSSVGGGSTWMGRRCTGRSSLKRPRTPVSSRASRAASPEGAAARSLLRRRPRYGWAKGSSGIPAHASRGLAPGSTDRSG